MSQYGYDSRYEPPAPVVPVRVSPPGDVPTVGLPALLDTGADVSAIPEVVARSLDLPLIAQLSVRGVGGQIRPANVYAAKIEFDGLTMLCEVVGLGDEALLGRDLLNQRTLVLHGPHQVLDVS